MIRTTVYNDNHQHESRLPWIVGIIMILLALLLSTIKYLQPPPHPPLYTPAPTFQASDRYVSTIVFHWFIASSGQRSGPWLPLETRNQWNGDPKWWKQQIKQIMSANIDIIYVIVIPKFEGQRINLFTALNELRAEGYDTPKVAPFLDAVITWVDQPKIDLATESGKDEFVGQYIRFFEQYFAASNGDHAEDYLARQANKPILNTWHVHLNTSNIPALTRSDVSDRLKGAFADYPPFSNGFTMVTTALKAPMLQFADEKVVQFQLNEYYHSVSYNGIRSVQLKGGYWDQNVRNPGDFLPRDGGSHYRNAWDQVDRETTQRVYIESWNEYDEGSGIYAAQNKPYIAPDNTSGNADVWSETADPYEYIRTTARGAAAFNDTPELDAQILWHDIPATMTPGDSRTATIIVRNTGDESWTGADGFKLGQPASAPSLISDKVVQIDDSKDEIPVYGGIFRGRPIAFKITLQAPKQIGQYTMSWRMQQGHDTWFGEELKIAIEIEDKS